METGIIAEKKTTQVRNQQQQKQQEYFGKAEEYMLSCS